ncbi:MAG: FMN-binding protein [Paenibacillaceae bacterium]
MMARMGNKLIAICSAAIGIIYAAGYLVTETTAADTVQNEIAMTQSTSAPSSKPSEQSIQSQQAAPVTSQNTETADATTAPAPVTQQAATSKPIPTNKPKTPAPITAKPQNMKPTPTSTPSPSHTPSPSPQPTPIVQDQKYQDGTYAGSGTNRFGTVEVEVTIEKGKIANVDITSSRTRYPQRYIDPLPAEVVDSQDYNIDAVSGATRSSEDFINAVREALLQAEGNN